MAAVMAAAFGVFASRCPAQTVATFEQWWAKVSANGKEGPNVDGLRIHYKTETFYPKPSQSEMSDIEARIKDKPDHPDRHRLWEFQRQLNAPSPEVGECTMWRLDGRWRYNAASSYNTQFTDCAWDKGHSWMLTPEFVRILDPRRAEVSHFRVDLFVGNLVNDSGALVNASLGAFTSMISVTLSPKRDASGRRWSVKGEGKDSAGRSDSLEVDGTWDPSAGWGTIERLKWVGRPTNGLVEGMIYELRDWKFIPRIGLGIASESRELSLEGALTKRYTVLDMGEFTEREFDKFVAIPKADRPDPVRGALTFATIEDYRTLSPVITDREGRPIGVTAQIQQAQTASVRLRWMGWVVGVSVVAIALILWLLKRQRLAV